MEEGGLLFETLPDQVAGMVSPLRVLSRKLLQLSLQRLLSPAGGLPDQRVLRRMDADLQFFLTKTESGNIFLFFKRKKRGTEVVIDIDVHFSVTPIIADRPIVLLDKINTTYLWRPPPFLILDKQELTGLAPAEDQLDVDQLIGLSDGGLHHMLLEFEDPEALKARLWYDRQPLEARKEQWPAEPFFILYQNIREWVEGTWTDGRRRPLNLDKGNDVARIVGVIAESFRAGRRTLADDPGPYAEEYDLWSLNRIAYDLDRFQSEITLRLDEAGKLASYKEKRSFLLGLQMELRNRGNYHEALIDMRLPDFLVSGDLYEAFWDAFLYPRESTGACRKKLLKLLQDQGYPLDAEALLDLLERGAAGKGTVFRIDREEKTDINLFVVSGEVNGTIQTLVFSGKFVVESVVPPRVELQRKGSLKVHYRPEDDQVDQELVDYFLRLIRYFKNWMDLLR